MDIIFPPLVEQGFRYHFEENEQQHIGKKATFYRWMVEKSLSPKQDCRQKKQ